MKLAIYTAIFGGYDTPQLVPAEMRDREDTDFFMFTDDPNLDPPTPWNLIVIYPGLGSSLMNAKFLKVMAHENFFYSSYDASVWVDGNLQLQGNWDFRNVFLEDGVSKYGVKFAPSLVLIEHYERNCLFEELGVCLERGLDDRSLLYSDKLSYEMIGMKKPTGLYFGNFIGRWHTASTIRFNRLWWYLITCGSRRDQIHLPVAVELSGISTKIIPSNERTKFFLPIDHKKERVVND